MLLSNIINTPSINLFVGAPRSGKSYLMKYLLIKLALEGKFKYGLVFSPSDNTFESVIPGKYLHRLYNDDKLKSFLRLQKKSKQQAFLIIDDGIGSINLKTELFKHLFTSYRHYNITIFLSVQYVYSVPPVIRQCATYVYIFKHSNQRSFEALFLSYFSDMNNWRDVRNEMNNKLKQKYTFILINNETGCRKVLKAPSNFNGCKLIY